jgi:hypothetical protein
MQSSFMEGPFVDEAAIEDARVRVWVCVLALERRDIVWVVRALWALFWVPLSVLLPTCKRDDVRRSQGRYLKTRVRARVRARSNERRDRQQ